ncbi:TPD domain-containing protein [Balamuthia mandrillaris]
MKQMYDRGEDIGSISHQLDVPPMTAFRAILTARGWSKQRIRKAVREPSDRQSGFGGSGRDMAQLAMAQSLDVVTNNDQARQIEDSERFESIIEEYLKVQGIRFKRQEELTEEQQLLFDRAVNTPDFVLLDSVSINSKPVRWIEAKNFFGADLPFPQRDIHKQLSRYCSTWGPGAVIFSLGYCESFQVPEGVMLLDASVLDLSSLLTSEE